jgi:hypothetical protein
MNHSDPLRRRWAIQPAEGRRHGTIAILVATALLSVGTASADPVPANQCGAHTDALDCIRDTSPITPAEAQYAGQVGRAYPSVNGMTILNYFRATCGMLREGVTSKAVVVDLAQHLGTTMQAADQVLDEAMEADCPNLHVGVDGVAR